MEHLSSGCLDLDGLLEALWPGDNVVFVGGTTAEYEALARAALTHASHEGWPALTIELHPHLLAGLEGVGRLTPSIIWDERRSALLNDAFESIEPNAYVAVQELASLFADEGEAVSFFTSVCPDLYRRKAVAYWHLAEGAFSPRALAAIRDCTQVFVRIEHNGPDRIITPLKVEGRYADDMFRPHRLLIEPELAIEPLRTDPLAQGDHAEALLSKNRELVAIRDQLNRANRLLEEQSRLYESLSANLDQLVELLQVGRRIGASLSGEQVQQAVVRSTLALFRGERARLTIEGGDDPQTVEMVASDSRRSAVGQTRYAQAIVSLRPPRSGRLQVWTPASMLTDQQLQRLLEYLALEVGIALDNAELHRETEAQKEQLRVFVSEIIASEERDSRQLALDLHDGLVQQLVASYQHLQTAQAWCGRDPEMQQREEQQGIDILRQSIVEARRLIAQLRPVGLDDFGLARAVRLFANQQAADNDWQVECQIDPQWPELPATVEAALYRIIQEATNNARKYARSPRLRISLRLQRDDHVIEVRDWGRGFDPQAVLNRAEHGRRVGLVGIRERANLLGGACEIESIAGQGTCIRVRLLRQVPQERES